MERGYNHPLFVMPFDQRSSFAKGLFGFKPPLTDDQTAVVIASKQVVYEGFKLALSKGAPLDTAAILVDEQFGSAILRDARAQDFITCVVAVARRDGRSRVGCIVLGRGADEAGVLSWLGTAAAVPGFIGFAIGRTSFWDPLVGLRDRVLSRDAAAARIADRYAEWIQAFTAARAG